MKKDPPLRPLTLHLSSSIHTDKILNLMLNRLLITIEEFDVNSVYAQEQS